MAVLVEFHTGVADELGYACRLLRKAYHKGARLLVRAPAARLARLDRELWTFVERDFVPHLRFSSPGALPAQAARTPIWLVDGELPTPCPPVWVHLGADVPLQLDGAERVIEIVGADADEVQRGRQRWQTYKALGVELKHHVVGAGDG